MPGFDRTGPRGAGPMTGGLRGDCAPTGVPFADGGLFPAIRRGFQTYLRPFRMARPFGTRLGLGRGFRGGRGRGRGRGR